MRLDNGKVSERQSFRLGILENITLGIVVVPYVCSSVAGKWHYMAFLLGLIFTFLYAFVIFLLSKAFPEGMIEEMDGLLGGFAKIFDIIYAARYIIKASLIILFFSAILRAYMLRSFNLWAILIPFTIICGYGASRDIEKRGRLIELLFWWMICPLILVAAFSISNIEWNLGGNKGLVNGKGIMLGGYEMLIVMSSIELMLFTLTKQRKNNWKNALRTIIWVLLALVFAYIFVQGVIGAKWVGSSSMSALYVMEAAHFPGGVERLDYAVIAFWIIGVFAIVSGYMFYAKEFIRVAFSKRWNTFEKNEMYRINNNSVEIVSDKWWNVVAVILLTFLGIWAWSLKYSSEILMNYLLWVDLVISLLIPFFVLFIKKIKDRKKEKIWNTALAKKTIELLFIVSMSCLMLGGCKKNISYEKIDNRQSSLETMDYAVELTVKENINDKKIENADYMYTFVFKVADLSDYKGDSDNLLITNDYSCGAESLKDALDKYYKDKEKHIDLGHLKAINIYDNEDDKKIKDIIFELKDMPSVTKSVKVLLERDENTKKLNLRKLIKNMYAGENF